MLGGSRRLCARLLAAAAGSSCQGGASRLQLAGAVPQQPPAALGSSVLARLFASKPRHSSKPGRSKHNNKKQALLQQQTAVDSRSSAPRPRAGSSSSSSQVRGSIPQPGPFVLPDLGAAVAAAAAAPPRLGRVPPSSSAAAAAAASFLKAQPGRDAAAGAAAAAQKQRTTQLLRHRRRSPASTAAAAAAAESAAQDTDADPSSYIRLDHLVPPSQVLPWDVVGALRQSCAFSLPALAEGGIATYCAYLRAARLGMPSVFDLGVVRAQGHAARRHLLQRERVLLALVQQLQPELEPAPGDRLSSGSGDAGSSSGSDSDDGGSSSASLHDSAGQHLQQHPQLPGVGWQPSDEQLEGLSEQQLAAAAAAASGSPLLPAVTVEDVTECLVDYFVFKRCMETMLLQRQHRHALRDKHFRLLQQHTGRQQEGPEQQQQQQTPTPPPPLTLVSPAELAEVKVWDAFFDATLEDFVLYLEAATLGAPSVFTVPAHAVMPHAQEQQQPSSPQQQHKQTLTYQKACAEIGLAAAALSLLTKQQMRRPGRMTKQDVVALAVQLPGEDAAADLELVLQLFANFYEAKRTAFRQVLEELLGAAGQDAAGSMGRF